jgi:hypothetical protein
LKILISEDELAIAASHYDFLQARGHTVVPRPTA